MKTYDFHGSVNLSEIGKRIREICEKEGKSFKLLTGYGSTSGTSKSKNSAMRSLAKLKKEGIIKDYFGGETLNTLHKDPNSYGYEIKMNYTQKLKGDKDFGNDGIIFVFLK